MLLKLLKNDIVIIFVPGSELNLVDALSRAYWKDHVEDDPDLEAIVHTVSKYLAMSEEKESDEANEHRWNVHNSL